MEKADIKRTLDQFEDLKEALQFAGYDPEKIIQDFRVYRDTLKKQENIKKQKSERYDFSFLINA